jgi:hypothetical protein
MVPSSDGSVIRKGVRVNFVRKIEQNPYASVNTSQDGDIPGVFSPVTRVDPGLDGITGTTDDRTITVYNLRSDLTNANTPLLKNFPGVGSNYSTLEVSVTKRFSRRWQAMFGFDDKTPAAGFVLDPNTIAWGGQSEVHYRVGP